MNSRNALASLLVGLPLLSGCIIHISGDGWDTSGNYTYRSKTPRLRGNGVEAQEKRTTADFDAVQVSDAVDLDVRVGRERSVTLHGDENLLRHVRTVVQGGSLEISVDKSYSSELDIQAIVTLPDLRAVVCSGSSDVLIDGIDREDFAISASGTCDVTVSGRVARLAVEASGASDLHLFGLEAQDVTLTLTGDSDVNVTALKSIQANLTGTSDVRYRGNPTCALSSSGASSLKPE